MQIMKEKITCFLIDDDTDDQEIFMMALEAFHNEIECITANDGINALEQLQDEHFTPDYIFLDLNMPMMDGKQCLKEIKKIDRLNEVPVIIYSTSDDPREMQILRDLGASDYLVKQASMSTLRNMLAQFFQQPDSYPL